MHNINIYRYCRLPTNDSSAVVKKRLWKDVEGVAMSKTYNAFLVLKDTILLQFRMQ